MQEMTWKAWFQHNTDKFVLLILFWTLLGFVIYTIGMKYDEGAVDWARSSTDLVLGGLLGLITGKYLAEKKIPTLDKSQDEPLAKPPE